MLLKALLIQSVCSLLHTSNDQGIRLGIVTFDRPCHRDLPIFKLS